jgi:hypothetical protein
MKDKGLAMKTTFSRIVTVLLLVLFTASVAYTADYEFRVIGAQGGVEIKRSTGKTEKAKIGSKLKSGDALLVAESSSANLCHSSGKTVRITVSGTYSISQIENKLGQGNSSVSQKLAKSVIEDMGKSDNMLSSGGMKGKTSLTGAGTRGTTGITPLTAYKSKQFADDISFKWSRYADEKNYRFVVTNVYDEVILRRDVKDTCFVTNNRDLKLKTDDYYFWYVSPMSDTTIKSKNIGFVILSDQKITAIRESESQIKLEFSDDVAFQKLILAKLYEQNELMDNALSILGEAIKLSPNDDEVQTAYYSFIVRNKIPE